MRWQTHQYLTGKPAWQPTNLRELALLAGLATDLYSLYHLVVHSVTLPQELKKWHSRSASPAGSSSDVGPPEGHSSIHRIHKEKTK